MMNSTFTLASSCFPLLEPISDRQALFVPLHHAAAHHADVTEADHPKLSGCGGRHPVRATDEDYRLVLQGRDLGQARLKIGQWQIAGAGNVAERPSKVVWRAYVDDGDAALVGEQP